MNSDLLRNKPEMCGLGESKLLSNNKTFTYFVLPSSFVLGIFIARDYICHTGLPSFKLTTGFLLQNSHLLLKGNCSFLSAQAFTAMLSLLSTCFGSELCTVLTFLFFVFVFLFSFLS